MSETKHESDVRVLSGFVRGQRNLVGDHWTPSMACEALDRVLAALATERAAREAVAEKAVELAVKYSDAVDRAIAAEARESALRSQHDGLRKRVRTLAHQWESHPYMPLDMGTAAKKLRELLSAGGSDSD